MLWVMLNSRRGRIEGMDSRAGAQIIRAKVPLSEMFGYSTTLRSGTQGRGVFSMELSHYEEVPKSISEEIIASKRRIGRYEGCEIASHDLSSNINIS